MNRDVVLNPCPACGATPHEVSFPPPARGPANTDPTRAYTIGLTVHVLKPCGHRFRESVTQMVPHVSFHGQVP